MLRGARLQKLSLYSLFGFILLLFVFAVWIANNPQASEQYCQSHNSANEHCPQLSPFIIALIYIGDALNFISPALSALSGIAVALFTLALWISTEKLWKVADRQSIDMTRSIKAAEDAAVAGLRQAETSEKAMISANRPWITVDVELAGAAKVSRTDVNFTFKFTIKNIGNSPALKVHLAPIILDRMSCTPQIREFIHTTFMDSHILKNFAWGRSMAPNQERDLVYSLGFRQNMFEDVIAMNKILSPNNDRMLLAPIIAGFIQYEFNNSSTIHTTTFYYDIGRVTVLPASHGASGSFIYNFTENMVPIDRIHLEESFSCGAEMS